MGILSEESMGLINRAIGFYDGEHVKNNVVSYLARNTRQHPGKRAFRWPSAVPSAGDMPHDFITFEEFYRTIEFTGGGLGKLGIKRGDCVIIFLPMSLALYQALAGVMMIGARAVFLDSWARRDMLGECARLISPAGIITFEDAFDLCRQVPLLDSIPVKVVAGSHRQDYQISLEQLGGSGIPCDIQGVTGDETALVTFTTGSSGMPRGADRTHGFLSCQHMALKRVIPYDETDVDLPAFPIFSLNNLAGGIDTVIPAVDIGRPSVDDPRLLTQQLQSTGATTATLSPSMIRGLASYCRDENIILPNLRRVVTGGAPMGRHVLDMFRKCIPDGEIVVLYGSTEVEPIACIEASSIPGPCGDESEQGVLLGPVVDSLDYHIIRITRGPVALPVEGWSPLLVKKGEPGELVVSGLHVCRSYYNNPGATEVNKILDSKGQVWHRTGDVVWEDKDNNLWMAGRVHNAIRRGGEVLFPVEAEETIKSLPGVSQAAYLGMPCQRLGEMAVAVVKPEKNISDINSLIEVVRGELQNRGIVFDHVIAFDHIPMDPRHHSKVEYETLRKNLMQAGLLEEGSL